MGKKIFITGAAGFIGFHLARYLAKRGDHVIGFDNFNDYYTPLLKRARAHILKKEGIQVIEGDICGNELVKAVSEHKTTHLVHLAAQAGVRYSLINPMAYIKSNIEGFENVLEICRQNPNIKLTYASSSSVYGKNEKIPFAETDRTDNQASLYGVTKKTNELMATTYHHLHGISVTGLRFFTVYGPWGRPDMAYYSFAEAILDGRPIEVFNEGRMQRDFTYIDDIVAGTAAAIDLESPCEIFNLGNSQPEQLLTFIRILEEILNKKAFIQFKPMQPGDVISTYADLTHSHQHLGFKPTTSIKQGLEHFVSWFRTDGLQFTREAVIKYTQVNSKVGF